MQRAMSGLLAMLLVPLLVASAGADALWISDDDSTKTIYRVTLDGTLISSFPSVHGAESSVAVDPEDGTLWGTNEKPARIVNFTRTGAEISSFLTASFGAVGPEGVSVAPDGTLWVVDDEDPGPPPHRNVYNITKAGVLISVFPTSTYDPASVSPQAIAVDASDGTLWITDNAADKIYNISTSGALLAALPVSLFDPGAGNLQGIGVDPQNGSLWVTARDTHTIYNISRSGALLSSFASTSYDPSSFNPTGVAVGDTSDLECLDGLDNDGDGRIDFDPVTRADPAFQAGTGDPGCFSPRYPIETTQCQDGINNDVDEDPNPGLIDFDGGQSIHGACSGGVCPPGVSDPNSDGVADPDPECVARPWRNREEKRRCGLGFELVFLLPPLMWLHRRRRRISA